MNRFNQFFSDKTKKAFVPFFMPGDPTSEESYRLITSAIDAGADILEFSIPFSDPIADGPVIQAASERVLANGFGVKESVQLFRRVRDYHREIPISILVYYNVLFRGGDRLYAELKAAGVDAIGVIDLPMEEAAEHNALCHQYDIGIVPLIALNTPLARAKKMLASATAYAYVISRYGVTGDASPVPPQIAERLAALRALSDCPLIVGFGLSTASHVKSVFNAGGHGAIIASAIVKRVAADGVDKTTSWLRELIAAIHQE